MDVACCAFVWYKECNLVEIWAHVTYLRLWRIRMKSAFLGSWALPLFFLMISGPALAHHGVQGYDHSKKVTFKGTVSEFAWANPHAQIYLDVKDDSGQVIHWGLELNSPGNLVRLGWGHSSLKPGEPVEATFFPSENGKHLGICVDIVKANGMKLHSNQGCGNNPAQNN